MIKIMIPKKIKIKRVARKRPLEARKPPKKHLDVVMSKGGKLPPGTRRTWGGKEYIKTVAGKWRIYMENVPENRDDDLTETEGEKALSDIELKKSCYEYARSHFQGKRFKNAETGREIIVSKDGLGEWKTKSKSREQILSIKIIDKLLEGSRFVKREADTRKRRSVIGYSYFTMDCRINGMEHNAIITVKETEQGGDKYYHHYLEDIKIEPYSGITRPADESA